MGRRMKKLLILTKDSIVNTVTSKRAIVFLILYTGIFLLIAYGFMELQLELQKQMKAFGVSENQERMVTEIAKAFFKAQANNELVNYLLSVPFFNVALFFVSIFGTPLLIIILKYDILAQERYDGTLRFLLFRVSRLKIIASRFVSSLFEIMFLTLIAFLAAFFWAALRIPDFPLLKSFLTGLYFWGVSQLYFSVIIAFSMLFSTFVKKPITALILGFLTLFGLSILPIWVPAVSPLDLVHLGGLLAGPSISLLLSALVYLFYTGLFLLAGYFIFKRKDL